MATAKLLYRRLDALFGSLKTRRSQPKLLETFLEDCFANLKDDLRLRAGLLYAERRDDFALVKAVGDPGLPLAETLDPALPHPRRGQAAPRLHLPRPRRRRLPAPAGAPAPRGGGRPPGRAAAVALRDLLPPRRRLAGGRARLRPQHHPRLARRAARGRARARLLPRGGGDPAEPPRRGAAALPRLRPRRALAGRGRGGRRLLRLPQLQRGHARPLDRRRERPRPARGAPRARRGDRDCAWGSRRS